MKIDVTQDTLLRALVEAISDERDHGGALMRLMSRLVNEASKQGWFETHWRTEARLKLAQLACGDIPQDWRSAAPALDVIAEAARWALRADQIDSEGRAALLAITRLVDVERSVRTGAEADTRSALKPARRRKAKAAKAQPTAKSASVRKAAGAATVSKSRATKPAKRAGAAKIAKVRPTAKSASARKAAGAATVSKSRATQPAKRARAAKIAKVRPTAKSASARKANGAAPISKSRTAKPAKPAVKAKATKATVAKVRPTARSASARKANQAAKVAKAQPATKATSARMTNGKFPANRRPETPASVL